VCWTSGRSSIWLFWIITYYVFYVSIPSLCFQTTSLNVAICIFHVHLLMICDKSCNLQSSRLWFTGWSATFFWGKCILKSWSQIRPTDSWRHWSWGQLWGWSRFLLFRWVSSTCCFYLLNNL
jgi:hypothetical protein